MAKMEEFLARYENPSHCVDTLLDQEVKQVFETNQKIVESLLKMSFFVISKVSHYVDIVMMEYTGMMVLEAQMNAILFSWFDFMQKLIPSLLII